MDAEVEDGSSVEKAIVVQRVSEEYTWMRNNLPAFRMRSQSLIMRDCKMYDEMTLQSSEGRGTQGLLRCHRWIRQDMSPASIMKLNAYWGAYYTVACTTMFFTRWNFAQAVAAVVTQELSRLIWQGCPIALYATSRVDRGYDSRLYRSLGKYGDKVLIGQPITTFIILVGVVGYFVPEPPSNMLTVISIGAGFIATGFALTRYRVKTRVRVIRRRQAPNF